ncbi:peroxin, partial [Tulasnella sp. UAMH 9824]
LTESEQDKLQGVRPDSEATLSASTTQRTEWESVLIPLTGASEQQTLLSGGLSAEHVLSSLRDGAFRTLMDDTRVLLNGQDFAVVFEKAMDWGVDWFLERVQREMFDIRCEDQGEGDEKEEKRVKLAAMLPGVARLSHTLVNSMPNELIEGMSQLPEMSAFSAIIFASYEERLRPQDEML